MSLLGLRQGGRDFQLREGSKRGYIESGEICGRVKDERGSWDRRGIGDGIG